MSFDRSRFGDHLGVERVRERLDDFYAYAFLPPSVTRESLSEETDQDVAETTTTDAVMADDELADRADAESSSDETDFGEFQFGPWLDEGEESGPKKPPSEPRVVTGTIDSAAGGPVSPVEQGGFDFVAWLEEDGAVATLEAEPDPEPVVEVDHDGFAFSEWLVAGEEYEPIVFGEADGQEFVTEPAVQPSSIGWSTLRPGVHPAKVATYAMFLAVVVLAALSVVGHLPALGPTAGL